MKRWNPVLQAMFASLLPAAAVLVLSIPCAMPALADIYRWEDEGGVIHFTDDISAIPEKYRGASREILKTPPAAGQPSLSTMGAPSPPPDPSVSPGSSSGETIDRPEFPVDDAATMAEKLRAKIDAKERFLRAVDEKQSLASSPYR